MYEVKDFDVGINAKLTNVSGRLKIRGWRDLALLHINFAGISVVLRSFV